MYKTTPIPLLIGTLVLISTLSYAGSAIWNQSPTSGDWDTAANWTPDTFPNHSAEGITPIIAEQAKLVARDGDQGDSFGNHVSVSGNYALVGAPFANSNTGAAYVFFFDGATWTQQAELVASDGEPSTFFGGSVALFGDIALVGAYGGDNFTGAAYIFEFDGTTWTQQAKLTASDGVPNQYFGISVSVSGNLALVGADFALGDGIGSAYIFAFDGTTWTQQAKLAASDGAIGERFGISVSLSGKRALVGAYDAAPASAGAAYIFASNGGLWNQEAKLTASDTTTNERFGCSVALSGKRAIIGAYNDNFSTGAAYMFSANQTTWNQQAKLIAPDGEPNSFFGTSVALSGKRALIGAPSTYVFPVISGSGYIFVPAGSRWVQQAELTPAPPDDVDGEGFGGCVSLDGARLLIGAPGDKNLKGAAFVYGR